MCYRLRILLPLDVTSFGLASRDRSRHDGGIHGGSGARRFERQRGNDDPPCNDSRKEPRLVDHPLVIDSGLRWQNFVELRKWSPWLHRSIGASLSAVWPPLCLFLSTRAPSTASQQCIVSALPLSYRSCSDTCNDDADLRRLNNSRQ